MGRLNGKVALVSGAARGQGRQLAVRLAEEGADVIAVDSTAALASFAAEPATIDDFAETARLVRDAGVRLRTVDADVRDAALLVELLGEAVAELGGLDLVTAIADTSGHAPTLEMSAQLWQDVIDINLTGVWKLLAAAVPHVVSGGRGGSVVIVTSLAALDAPEHTAHYSVAKAGLVMLMKTLAKELAPHDIRVNSVHPASPATAAFLEPASLHQFHPELARTGPAGTSKLLRRLPVATLDQDDVTNAVLYLVSDDSRYVTGTTLVIDAAGLD